MKLFYIPSKKNIAQNISKITNISIGKSEVNKFLDGDLYAIIKDNINKKRCLILGGTEKEQILETAILSHTLKKEGAKEITAIIPYLAYARQDRNIKGKSLGINFIGNILKVSGVSRVISIDIHSSECKKHFPVPLISLSPYNLFAKKINPKKNQEVSMVTPDKGAIDNALYFIKALNNKFKIPIFYINKKRTEQKIKIVKSYGVVMKDIILVDDILNSGDTIINAVKETKKKGAKNMTIVVSHGLFNGNKWKKLWGLGVKAIYCTDSVGKKIKDKRIHYIKSAEIIARYFK